MIDPTDHAQPDASIADFVRNAGLTAPGMPIAMRRLTGGVSSDIWLVESGGEPVCLKRALPKLRVVADWFAPVERNANEAAWFGTVAQFMPEAVPRVLAEDAAAGLFAMQYLPEDSYANWKAQLRDGMVDVDVAREVGRRLGRIHSVTARMPDLPARFASDAIFHAIRLEPYLLATAQAHPDLAERLRALAHVTATTKRALVHGDVSPKNILIGPHGPVFIDAECAWWGDPAFDVAFCLNHLLLKCLWVPQRQDTLIAAFKALATAHCASVDWEPTNGFEQRTAHLLPALLLARIDGKSPVEYVTDEADKNRVRRVATALLRDPPPVLAAVADLWQEDLQN